MLKIGTSWVRGVVGEGLTSEIAVRFGSAFGSWVDGRDIILGIDSRNSSPMLRSAVISGLMYSGRRTLDLGICPTPLVSFAIRELGASGGISISGSHNDSRWNALKFFGPDGVLLGTDKTEELLDIYHASDFTPDSKRLFNQPVSPVELEDRYLSHLLSFIDAEMIRERGFAVAVDLRYGTCAGVTEKLMEMLGCRLVGINADGNLPEGYSPAPGRAHMEALGEAVRESGADLGAAINVDGDRISFVTGKGRILSEEMTFPLAAINRLGRRTGPIVTNHSTSNMIDRVAGTYGAVLTRTRVGEAHVVNRGLEDGAILAGEGSGGVAALPASMTYDALMTLEMILETLADKNSTIEEMAAGLPGLHMKKGEISCSPSSAYRALELFRLGQENIDPDCEDGVRIILPDGWVHVRVSGSESLIRVIAETSSPESVNEIFDKTILRIRGSLKEDS